VNLQNCRRAYLGARRQSSTICGYKVLCESLSVAKALESFDFVLLLYQLICELLQLLMQLLSQFPSGEETVAQESAGEFDGLV